MSQIQRSWVLVANLITYHHYRGGLFTQFAPASNLKNIGLMRYVSQVSLTHFAMACSIYALAGCSTVHVYGANVDTVKSTFLRVAVKPEPRNATVVLTRGIGIILGQRSATLGYLDETTVLIPPDAQCQTFIFVKDKSQVDSLRNSLRANPALHQLCVLSLGEIHEP